MPSVDLVFKLVPLSQPAALLFGEVETTADFTFTLDGTLPALSGAIELSYDNAVWRGVSGSTSGAWKTANPRPVNVQADMQQATRLPVAPSQPWTGAAPLQASSKSVLQQAVHAPAEHSAAWTGTNSVDASVLSAHQSSIHVERASAAGHAGATHVGADGSSSWQVRIRTERPARRSPWRSARKLTVDLIARQGVGAPVRNSWLTWWGDARKPPPGRYSIPVPPPVVTRCYTPSSALRFTEGFSSSPDLLFRCPFGPLTPTVAIPIRRTYIVLNTAHLKRVDGNIELPCYSLSLKIDMDTWTWGFNATLPASQLSNLDPGGPGNPVLLDASINGEHYRLLAESISRSRTFGKSSIAISGRGISAVLADPYSPVKSFSNTESRTAQQLMADALTVGGVPLGWDLDWQITDWLVPAGAWNHNGTYMSAVNAIAAAAGAFVQPDPVSQILRIRPRYPAAPWDWSAITPDFELPSEVMTTEGVAWADLPQYNAVYVSGTNAGGILGLVKRTGSAGDVVAPMVSDQLITHADAARQRGIPVLSNTGRIATYSLSLPVLAETGIILPGTMVRYVDAGNSSIGLVKGMSVNVSMPSVRQTIEVEAHA